MNKTKATDFLNKEIEVTIDRTLGSKHPKYGFSYPINYGFIQNTKAPDGEEIDAYVLFVDKPIKKFTGLCVGIIHRTNDNDDKLVVVPKDRSNVSDNEISEQVMFQEKYFESVIIRVR